MTNREKYAKEILDIACVGSPIAMDKHENKLCRCCDIKCKEECAFYDSKIDCSCIIAKWANSEYVEKPKISKKDKEFLSFIDGRHKYIARDVGKTLRLYYTKPCKNARSTGASLFPFGIKLPMVKWEDEEPWLIEDLKNLEVVEEYENN